MSIEVKVLGSMLRLARARREADVGSIALRVGSSEGEVRAALRRLDGQGLVERRLTAPPRLTFEGFAVAVALLPAKSSRAVRLRPARRAA